MKSSTQSSSNPLKQYYQIKNQLTIPLKLKILTNNSKLQNVPKQLTKIFKLLLNSFQKQTLQEKASFLKANIQFLKLFLQSPSKITQQSLDGISIDSIETQCHMMSKYIGVTCWNKAHFKLSKQKSKIIITVKSKQYTIDLRNYYARKSHKYKNTMKFQAISQDVKQKDRVYVIQFRNLFIFQQVYQHTRNCIIKFANQQLIVLCNQPSDQIMTTHMDRIERGFQILNPKAINDYFDFKDQLIQKIEKSQAKFKAISQSNQGKISFLKNKHEKDSIYKLQRIYNIPYNSLCSKLSMLSRIYPSGNLRHFEIVQSFSKTLQAVYYKYWILNKQYQFLSIIQDVENESERIVIIKGIDNLMVKKIINYFIIKVQKIQGMQSLSKVICYGLVNVKGIQASLANTFFLKDMTDIQGKVTKIIPASNEDGFISVRGEFQIDQHQMNFFQSTNIGNQRFQKTFQDKTLCLDKNGAIIYNEQIQNDDAFRNQQVQEVDYYTDANEKRKSQNTQKTTEQDQKIIDKHLKYKCKMQPKQLEIGLKKDLENQKYLNDEQWYRGKNGGLVWTNKKMIQQQKKVVKRILSQMGDNIMKCKSIMNISFPVQIFRKQSHLKTIARFFTYSPILIEQSIKQQPLTRMKKATAFAISQQVMGVCMDKPFNPLLGQTYQGYIDGCPVFLQQISHHPPISYYNFSGRGYKMYGSVQPKAQMRLNSVKGHSDNPQFIVYDDGMIIQHRSSPLLLKGIMFGNRQFHFEGKSYLFEQNNSIFVEILFGPKSTFLLSYNSQPFDQIFGSIFKVKSGYIQHFKDTGRKNYPKKSDIEYTYGTISGVWSQSIKYKSLIDNQQYQMLNFTKDFPCKLVDDINSLPSDGNYRQDLINFIKGDIELAQSQKYKIEQIQRKDRKLRQKK